MAGTVTFENVLSSIRRGSMTQREKGGQFERVIANYFRTSSVYRSALSDVWLWNDFPFRKEFGGQDTGIDLVIRTVSGDYWAVQCKCYDEDTSITKPMVDTFISTSSKKFHDDGDRYIPFSQRIWISTSMKWAKHARETLDNQDPPCTVIGTEELSQDASVDWGKLSENLFGDQAQAHGERSLLPHQKEALAKAADYYKDHDRGKMIMACGTGKTFTSLRLVEQETKGRGLVLVLVPSIALVNQTLNEWNNFAQEKLYNICVCSDPTASKRKKNDDSVEDLTDLALPSSTHPVTIARQMALLVEHGDGMVVVFSTYQSIEAISKAQQILRGEFKAPLDSLFPVDRVDHIDHSRTYDFDFIVCDEAHRTTGATISGEDESDFVKVHDNDFLHAKKRLYMTATPRLYDTNTKKKAKQNYITLCSMDDPALYGEEFYRIGFGQAVERGLLADYKVLILTVRDNVPVPQSVLAAVQDKDEEINTSDAVKLVGVMNALSKRVDPGSDNVKEVDPGLMHKAVAFCSRIKDSQAISRMFNQYAGAITDEFNKNLDDTTVHVEAKHIDGSMNADQRNELVNWLKKTPTDGDECHILTNVRCLSEGVDVPSLDAVIFLSARESQVDVVQSVGRVMRTAPGKKYGYIIIPIVVSADSDPNVILDNNKEYKVVWSVLNALRAHDDRFNAWVNKLELNDRKPGEDGTDGGGVVIVGPGAQVDGGTGEGSGRGPMFQGDLFDDHVKNALYAKMVKKVGQRHYWEEWAGDVADIAKRHQDRIRRLIETNEDYRTAFQMYMDGLHKNINPNLSQEEAIEMLSQHMVTKPVFDALFGNSQFTEHNPISQSMKNLLDLVGDTAYEKDQETMKGFYRSVQMRCEGIKNASGKQKIIIELYDKFFKKALSKTVDKLGIVYTPVEIVDFINQSVSDILWKEFHRKLSDENIHIIDPFTGTGTFIVRLIQSGLIPRKFLERKYKHELHANEIVLLAYYIASVNIENAYHDAMGEAAGSYTPFDGICLTDTFQLYEDAQEGKMLYKFSDVFPNNSKRVIDQTQTPMRIILGNPPYSKGQTSANDNAQNEHYEKLENRIASTYAKGTKATNKNALYNSYIKAFRWASDRLGEDGGIIGFVTSAGWLDNQGFNGLRKCFEEEFSSIYVFNLRGDQRTNGEMSRKEGGKVFGSGSRTPIAITILVKKPKQEGEKAVIYYREVADYLTRKQKLLEVKDLKSVASDGFVQRELKPDSNGDWLSHRSKLFSGFTSIESAKKFDDFARSVFCLNSRGLETGRDAWIFNFSKKKEEQNIVRMIAFYNSQREKLQGSDSSEISSLVDMNPKKISWTTSLLTSLKRNINVNYDVQNLCRGLYRPYQMEAVYIGPYVIHRKGQMGDLFPMEDSENLLICTSGVGSTKPFSSLICKQIPSLDYLEKTQCFPLYYYTRELSQDEKEQEKSGMGNLFMGEAKEKPRYTRHDGVTDYILKAAQKQYGKDVTKEDIFYYVYGLLHSEDYRKEFAADLKKMLPRIPLVEKREDFDAFSKAGRDLAALHLHYEDQEPPAGVVVEKDADDYTVTKMKFGGKGKEKDRSVIEYNPHITIKGIPAAAYDYVVNGRSAIEWIMESYRVKEDKASGIVNDPNDWAKEHHDPSYILRLLLSIITVSLKTMDIIRALPHLSFAGKGGEE